MKPAAAAGLAVLAFVVFLVIGSLRSDSSGPQQSPEVAAAAAKTPAPPAKLPSFGSAPAVPGLVTARPKPKPTAAPRRAPAPVRIVAPAPRPQVVVTPAPTPAPTRAPVTVPVQTPVPVTPAPTPRPKPTPRPTPESTFDDGGQPNTDNVNDSGSGP